MLNKKGFSAIEFILILVVLALIGVSVFYAIDSRSDDDSSDTNTTNQTVIDQAEDLQEETIERNEDIDEQLEEIESIDLDEELDTSDLEAELDALL